MEKVFRALIAKEKVFPFICIKFTIFASEYQASFPLVCCSEVGAFFVSKVSILFLTYISILLLQIQADLCSLVFADFSGRISSVFYTLLFLELSLRFCQGLFVDHFFRACRKTLVNLTTSLPSSCFFCNILAVLSHRYSR